jgi:cell division septum initiation protein DivIVA
VIPRFPVVRQGYDCAAVDAYVGELERDIAELDRELVALRARLATPDEVQTEIKRIGEQTSSVLIAAHEQREDILRGAQEEADRCVAEAREKASAIMAQAQAGVREAETGVRDAEARSQATHRERYRLLDEVRTISAELAALADAGQGRIPAEVAGG